MKTHLRFLVIAGVVAVTSCLAGEPRRMTAARAQTPPAVDGRLDDPCWQGAAKIEQLVPNAGEDTKVLAPAREKTEVYLCFDEKAIYVGFKCHESRMDKVMARVKDALREKVHHDDCVEVFLDPEGNGRAYSQFLVNAVGTKQCVQNYEFTSDDRWNAASFQDKDFWSAEMMIPFDFFTIRPGIGSCWRGNFCREEKRLAENSCWAQTGGSFHSPEKFGGIDGLCINFAPRYASYFKGKAGRLGEAFSAMEKSLPELPPNGRECFERIRKQAVQIRAAGLAPTGQVNSDLEWKRLSDEMDFFEKRLQAFKVSLADYGRFFPSGPKGKSPDCAVGLASTLEKILPDRPFEGDTGNEVRISAAKNEYEGFQAVIIPFFENDPGSVAFEGGNLTGKSGAAIGRENLEIRRVAYVETRHPNYATSHVGYWPDPLLPPGMKDFSMGKVNVRPYWLTYHIPKNAAPGDYQGRILVKSKDALIAQIEVKLRVYDFALPDRNSLDVFSNLYPWQLKERPGKSRMELFRSYAAELLRYRIGPGLCANWGVSWNAENPDFAALDENLSRFFEKGMGAFGINGDIEFFNHGYCNALDQGIGMEGANRYFEKMPAILKRCSAHLKAKGWIKDAFCWLIDEPYYKDIKYYIKVADMIKAAAPELKRVAPMHLGMLKEGSSESHVELLNKLVGHNEIWTFNLSDYDQVKDWAAERQRQGDKIWWCNNIGSKAPYPNWYLDEPAINHRIEFWMAYKHKINGIFSWGSNCWSGYAIEDGNRNWPEGAWNPMTYPTANADGYQLYPGPDGTPIPSIRMENIRDGIEDYEYLHLLGTRLEELKKRGVGGTPVAGGEKELAMTELFSSLTKYSGNPSVLIAKRAKMAELIEETGRLLHQAQP
ncbi:MAG: DUF6067 family protein [Verrucomicrobiae bacterium]|nr:DUF6067 family protein [Verrucomicrobiae bacterium]